MALIPRLVPVNQPKPASTVPAQRGFGIEPAWHQCHSSRRFAGASAGAPLVGLGESGTKYLIGGAPTVGKSTLAAALAAHLGIPWISTDQIRDIMRTVADRRTHPKLFNPEGHDAESLFSAFSAAQLVAIEVGQGEAAWTGIKALIERDYTWPQGFVVEGVNLLPHLIRRDLGAHADIRTVFVTETEPARMRDVIFSRGIWDAAGRYPDSVKEKELDWVLQYDAWLKEQAPAHGFPVVALRKDARDLGRVLEALKRP
jgi:2-phosphoglycerate kinase